MTELKKPERMMGADVVRIVACFTVLSVHFFLNNGFYSQPVVGAEMFIMVCMRSAFMICVPLFILLTGYLMRNKKLEKSYYGKIAKTLGIYVLASIACIVYKLVFLKTGNPLETILGIFAFSAAPYAWYVEMYIGLFLLIPFLNILYHALPSKKAKRVLILTMLVLTSLPQIVNIYVIKDASWWSFPASSTAYQEWLPQWWRGIYPITFYFIGAYIGEYKVCIPTGTGILAAVATLLLRGIFNYWRSAGSKFVWGVWDEYGSLLVLVPTVIVFLLLISPEYAGCPRVVKKAVGFISELTLGIYLTSYIFDNVFYKMLKEKVPVMTDRLPYYFVVVPAVFLCSMALSAVLEVLWRLGRLLVRRCREAIKKRRTAE